MSCLADPVGAVLALVAIALLLWLLRIVLRELP